MKLIEDIFVAAVMGGVFLFLLIGFCFMQIMKLLFRTWAEDKHD
jgi:ABC-type multidrug transport system permease subunit